MASIQDDILVTGKGDADHLRNLEATLSRLEEYGVRLKLGNASLGKSRLPIWAA